MEFLNANPGTATAKFRHDAMARVLAEAGVSREDGIAFSRDLEARTSEMLRESTAVRNAMRHFVMTSEVSVGAGTYSFEMYQSLGRPTFHRGNARSIPRADVTARQETFNIRHAAIAVGVDVFEEEASAFANANRGRAVNIAAEKRFSAIEGSEQFVNEITWHGASDVGLYGVLDYPWIPRQFLPTARGADVEEYVQQLHGLANSPNELTGEAESPNTMLIATEDYNFLATTRFSDSSDVTALQYFITSSPWISNVYPSNELSGAGPDGQNLVLVYRNDRRHLSFEVPRLAAALPTFRDNLDLITPMVTTMGGVQMKYPLSNAIGVIPNAAE